MSKVEQALKSAIEVLSAQLDPNVPYNEYCDPPLELAIEKCKAALAELEKCEQVLFAVKDYELCAKHFNRQTLCSLEKTDLHEIPLFTSPQPKEWVGLSDEEIIEIWESKRWGHECKFSRAIEAKLKELNT